MLLKCADRPDRLSQFLKTAQNHNFLVENPRKTGETANLPKNFYVVFYLLTAELSHGIFFSITFYPKKEDCHDEIDEKRIRKIMEVLWAADEPLCRADIIARSQDKTWKDSSVHILLNSMLKKEAIQEAGFVRRGKGYGRVFTPQSPRKLILLATCSTGKIVHSCLGCSLVS